MSKVREMIEAIACDDFDSARTALKATLADYMAGKVYVSNADLYGPDYDDDYKNTNVDDDLEIMADLHGGVVHDPDAHITNKKKKKPELNENSELSEGKVEEFAQYIADNIDEFLVAKYDLGPEDHPGDDVDKVELIVSKVFNKLGTMTKKEYKKVIHQAQGR
jgi:hypothetical protein